MATQHGFVVEVSHDVAAVEDDWARLESEGILTPFQTRACLHPLYAILAAGLRAKPLFVVVRDRQTSRPAMLLPLCSRRRLGLKMVEFADLGASDYNAPLLSRDFNPSPGEWQALWREISRRLTGGSILRLQKMPATIEGRANPLVAGQASRPMSVGAWSIDLPATLRDYDEHVLTPTFRRELAKKERRLAKRGPVVFFTATTVADRRRVFEVLTRQRQIRCDEMGRRNDLGDPLVRRFRDALVEADAAASPIRLSALQVGNDIVATMFALDHRGARHVVMTTFEGGQWKSCSPGSILTHKAIERCLAEGIRAFDLTIGDECYKRDFGTTRQPLYSYTKPLTAFGFIIGGGVRGAVWLRQAWARCRVEKSVAAAETSP